MDGVLTILNSGTCYNREKGDIVANLAKSHLDPTQEISLFGTKEEIKRGIITDVQTRQVTRKGFLGMRKTTTEITSAQRGHGTWMINAGPAGGTAGVDRPGSIEPVTGEKTFLKDKDDLFDFSQYQEQYKRTANKTGITGAGWEHNVIRALAIVDQLVSWSLYTPTGRQGQPAPNVTKPAPLKQVNLVGWSRGAVTCHMIAHALHDFTHQNAAVQSAVRNLHVRICAFDPVPGGSPNGDPYQDREKISVPDNVTHYLGIYSQHDSRKWFQPVIVTQLNPNYEFVVMPGDHGCMVELQQGHGKVAEIAKALCHRFLVDGGTVLLHPYVLNDIAILERYAAVLTELEWYKKQIGSILTSGGRKTRTFPQGFSQSQAFFVNKHHEDLFKREFPQIYAKLFGVHPTGILEFQKKALQGRAPTTVKRLAEAHYL